MGSDQVLYLAIASTIAAFVAFFFSGEVLGDAPESNEGNASGGWGVLQFISIQTVLIFVMSLSWSWLFWGGKGWWLPFQLSASLLSAAAMLFLYIGGMQLIAKLNSPSTLNGFKPTVGMTGVVYVSIPSGRDSHGIVTFMDAALGDIELDAVTMAGKEIPTGERVVITQISSNRVVVRPTSAAGNSLTKASFGKGK